MAHDHAVARPRGCRGPLCAQGHAALYRGPSAHPRVDGQGQQQALYDRDSGRHDESAGPPQRQSRFGRRRSGLRSAGAGVLLRPAGRGIPAGRLPSRSSRPHLRSRPTTPTICRSDRTLPACAPAVGPWLQGGLRSHRICCRSGRRRSAAILLRRRLCRAAAGDPHPVHPKGFRFV